MKLSKDRVGKRHRQHVGDVRSLAASIGKLGLLHPIVVDGEGRLVAGARRLAAVRLLGWRDVPVEPPGVPQRMLIGNECCVSVE